MPPSMYDANTAFASAHGFGNFGPHQFACLLGNQAMKIDAAPTRNFTPTHLGHLGRIGTGRNPRHLLPLDLKGEFDPFFRVSWRRRMRQ